MSVLRSQAAQVFGREAFKLAVWVGVFGSFSRGRQVETSDVDIVIFYNPEYSEEQVWECYSRCEKNRWGADPDESKLERVWGRKIDIVRIFAGTLVYEKDVEAVLHAQTVYGDFNNPVLRTLRSSYYQKVEEYHKRISDSKALASIAKKSEDSSKVGKPILNGHICLDLCPLGISIRPPNSKHVRRR
jgi:predicted nucleotidyltransferase